MKVLEEILVSDNNKLELMASFQQRIWHGEAFSLDERINSLLQDLAYDLDYYEPNENFRIECASYYGDAKLKVELLAVIEKIKVLYNN